jgi:two-component system, NarL family, nitrate/nitrite response regulator NarL
MQIYRSLDPLLDLEQPLDLEAELEHDPTVRALVVANDPLVRSSFVQRLAGAAAGEAQLDDDLGEVIAATGANLVLWDVGPAHGESIESKLSSIDVPVPVVALCPEGSDIRPLLSRGAAAVLLREVSSRRMLRHTLRSVLCGLTVIDPRFVEANLIGGDGESATRDDELSSDSLQPLTGREQEVLGLMATGLSNKQIGGRLGISAHTAKFHIGAILAKLDAQSRTEAVVRAVKRGLVMV